MTRALAIALTLTLASCHDDECSLEANVGTFFAEHDAVDCRFASTGPTTNGEIVGAVEVRSCILDALANSRAVVGGIVSHGIDSSTIYAFLGTADGDVRLLHEYTFGVRQLRSSDCDAVVVGEPGDARQHIGLVCAGEDLMPSCKSEL